MTEQNKAPPTIKSRNFTELGNAVSTAINDALVSGMPIEHACSVAVQVAADYFRDEYGNADLQRLADVVIARAALPMPERIAS